MRGLLLFALLFAMGCSPSAIQLQKTLEQNPNILVNAIKKNPDAIVGAINDAAKKQADARAAGQQQNTREAEFANPKQPEIGENRVIFGPKDAPVTIVEYSDFECPFCSRGYNTLKELMGKYPGKIRVLYKHLPLNFHPLAEPAARYYEAIALQDHKKAAQFHDKLFEQQGQLKTEGQAMLDRLAKEVGANVTKLAKDKDSQQVTDIINADKAEAAKFGFSGTPGFLINGVSIKGAYPAAEFQKVIDRHLAN